MNDLPMFCEGSPAKVERGTGANAVYIYNLKKRPYEDCYIITVVVLCTIVGADNILIDYLQGVVMHIAFVDELYVLACSVVTLQDLNIVLLNSSCFLGNTVVLICDGISKELCNICLRSFLPSIRQMLLL